MSGRDGIVQMCPAPSNACVRTVTAARAQGGLTLIELMVVVAVIAILATIVYPAYERLIQSVRRGDGRTAAHAVALAQERFFTVNGTYSVVPASIFTSGSPYLDGCDGKAGSLCPSEKQYYQWVTAGSNVANGRATSFTVTVTPTSGKSQANDKYCTSMTLDSRGIQGGAAQSGETVKCW